jgi:uncharacterized LabA/DUF88 family protein
MSEKIYRVGFIIDGFNLYHSLDEVYRKDKEKHSTKWLNLQSLCQSYIQAIGQELGERVALERVDYFSALATHLTAKHPEKVIKHKDYIRCLEKTEVRVNLGRFKKKEIKYRNHKCRVSIFTHEEKETDVALAVSAFELFHNDTIDVLAVVSGDSDLVPAVQAVKRNFPDKKVVAVFPSGRKSDDLEKNVDASIRISSKAYAKHQLPNPFQLDNLQIAKPETW